MHVVKLFVQQTFCMIQWLILSDCWIIIHVWILITWSLFAHHQNINLVFDLMVQSSKIATNNNILHWHIMKILRNKTTLNVIVLSYHDLFEWEQQWTDNDPNNRPDNAVTFTLIHKWTCFFQSFITSTDSRFTSLKCSLGVRLNSSWITGCRNCWNCSKTCTRVCISQTVLKFKH